MTQFIHVSGFYLDGWSASEHVVLKLTGHGTILSSLDRVYPIARVFSVSCSNPTAKCS